MTYERQTFTKRMNQTYAKIGDRALKIVSKFRGDYSNLPEDALNQLYDALEHLGGKIDRVDRISPRKIRFCPNAESSYEIVQGNLRKINTEIIKQTE